jgi:hypothetical protein
MYTYCVTKHGLSMSARFWAKVDIRSYDGCWEWTAARHNGHGFFNVGGRTTTAHRVSYEQIVGPIPDGLQLDHLCRNRGCVNPMHLEPVTCGENLARGETINAINAAKTHCPQGHPYSGENLKITPQGFRECKECNGAKALRYQARIRSGKY